MEHREYYPDYPLFFMDTGTEVLEHYFWLRYVIGIDGTSLPHETIEYLRGFKEVIHVG
ncbi:hypothetical protein C1646_752158 [Rhizophagus diaphanus]|nr:hypothetical protein C1646_752158 [Rhizophagus diaphanus] [Rhizophagus sp. MUCL 43196]